MAPSSILLCKDHGCTLQNPHPNVVIAQPAVQTRPSIKSGCLRRDSVQGVPLRGFVNIPACLVLLGHLASKREGFVSRLLQYFADFQTAYLSKRHKYHLTNLNSVSSVYVAAWRRVRLRALNLFSPSSLGRPRCPLGMSCKPSALGLVALPEVLPTSKIAAGLQAGP